MKKAVSLVLALAAAFILSAAAMASDKADSAADSRQTYPAGTVLAAAVTKTDVQVPDTGVTGFANVAVSCGAVALAVAGAAAIKH